ncbi:MAG: hypothetical protein AAFN51_08970 [Pseudomonadota bacterium]
MSDLVTYARKHNEANGEDNRDGHDHNFSSNGGHEGATDDTAIQALRDQRKRNLLATLMLSQGVPMLLAGDEFDNSQQGNNNAYCQDNPIGWADWSGAGGEFHHFLRNLVSLRSQYPVLRQQHFLHGAARSDGRPDVVWFGADGGEPDWANHGLSSFAVLLRCAAADPEHSGTSEDLLIVINRREHIEFSSPEGSGWKRIFDTGAVDGVPTQEAAIGEFLAIGAETVALFVRDQS